MLGTELASMMLGLSSVCNQNVDRITVGSARLLTRHRYRACCTIWWWPPFAPSSSGGRSKEVRVAVFWRVENNFSILLRSSPLLASSRHVVMRAIMTKASWKEQTRPQAEGNVRHWTYIVDLGECQSCRVRDCLPTCGISYSSVGRTGTNVRMLPGVVGLIAEISPSCKRTLFVTLFNFSLKGRGPLPACLPPRPHHRAEGPRIVKVSGIPRDRVTETRTAPEKII